MNTSYFISTLLSNFGVFSIEIINCEDICFFIDVFTVTLFKFYMTPDNCNLIYICMGFGYKNKVNKWYTEACKLAISKTWIIHTHTHTYVYTYNIYLYKIVLPSLSKISKPPRYGFNVWGKKRKDFPWTPEVIN